MSRLIWVVVCGYNGGVKGSKAQVSLRSSAAEYLTSHQESF